VIFIKIGSHRRKFSNSDSVEQKKNIIRKSLYSFNGKGFFFLKQLQLGLFHNSKNILMRIIKYVVSQFCKSKQRVLLKVFFKMHSVLIFLHCRVVSGRKLIKCPN
jgi:hypothetical protein